MIVLSSGSSERRFPGPASQVGLQLGVPGIPCLDIPIASAGSVFALSLGSRLAPQLGNILVVAAEKMSSIALREPLDRNISILFGDGAGACIVGPNDGPLRVLDSVLHSDGAYREDLCTGFDGRLSMNGLTVIMQAARKLPSTISEVLQKNSLAAAEIVMFFPHQANQNLITRVAKALGVPSERFYSNIARYGNTSSASMLIAACEYFRDTRLAPGEKVCFAGFGAGFHWGALLAEKC
jgi:3-oxoacyl-[acyl-carrier-protein] synthase-3